MLKLQHTEEGLLLWFLLSGSDDVGDRLLLRNVDGLGDLDLDGICGLLNGNLIFFLVFHASAVLLAE